jgi:NADPH-dependent 2,4-dienoyl-CoA reductase/sulfur reductase-like enzyme
VVGASFIALEVAASLRHRGIEVHVAAPEAVPLARVLGDELGGWVRSLHEENGVVFHLGRSIQGWDGARLAMDQGALEADFIVAGTGVAPRTALATAAGLAVDNGVIVDSVLRASAPGVYAAGDLAHFPDPHTGDLIRIEHWVHAERQGQHVARAILGDAAPFTDTPFFWSVHYGSTINYVGHVEGFDAVALDGSLAAQGATARFMKAGSVRAVATVGRDLDSLRAGLALEREAA